MLVAGMYVPVEVEGSVASASVRGGVCVDHKINILVES